MVRRSYEVLDTPEHYWQALDARKWVFTHSKISNFRVFGTVDIVMKGFCERNGKLVNYQQAMKWGSWLLNLPFIIMFLPRSFNSTVIIFMFFMTLSNRYKICISGDSPHKFSWLTAPLKIYIAWHFVYSNFYKYLTCSGVRENKLLGRCFSFSCTVYCMTNIGPTLCIQPHITLTIHTVIHAMRSWVTHFIIVTVSLGYWKEVPQLLDRIAWVIVPDKNSLHCWFLL